MNTQAVHSIRPGKMKTINGMVSVCCSVVDGNLNKATHVKDDVTCKRCLARMKSDCQKQEPRNK